MKRAWAQIRTHRTRYGALLLAIMISVGFVTTVLVFLDTESASLRHQLAAPARQADVVVDLDPDAVDPAPSTQQIESRLDTVPGLAERADVSAVHLRLDGQLVQVRPVVPESLRWAELAEGRWPGDAEEIAIDQAMAEERGLAVGDTIEGSLLGDADEDVTLRVSGITTATKSLMSGVSLQAYMTGSFVTAHAGDGESPLWILRAANGTSPDELLSQVQTALTGTELRALTAEDYGTEIATSLSGGIDMFAVILLVFCAIAAVVGLLIIANTFTILIAQRRQQIGLLRAVGASTGQVRGELLAEALVLGLIGSALGVALGIGLAVGATAITGSLAVGLSIPWTIALAAGVGLLITLVAAWLPSLRTSRILPLEALRVAATDQARSRPGVATTVVAGLLVLAGAGLLGLAAASDGSRLLLGVGAAGALALGLLLGAGWYVPGIVRMVGALPSVAGPTARLAAANAVRNPKRTTATCLALMLAVGLVATLQVGSASSKASAEAGIVASSPVPLTVSGATWGEQLPADTADRVAGVDGVGAAIPVVSGEVELDGTALSVFGVGPEVAHIVPGLSIGPNDLVVVDSYAQERGWSDGQQVTVEVGGVGDRSLTVRVHNIAGYGGAVVAADTVRQWAPDAAVTDVWATVDTRDAAAARATMESVQELDTNLVIGGSIAYTTILTQVLDTLLMVATALLGAAVLIALIGVGNTLGLSVLERTRESALLRALGLQRSQLRATLAVEAVLIAITAALVGIAVGIGFGFLGTWSLLAELDEPLLLTVPVPMLVADVAVAVVAALLASVLPSRRAAMATPTEALAAV